jgi:hypothetical protein
VYKRQTWDRLEVEGIDNWRIFKPGDFLQMNLLEADGSMSTASQAELRHAAMLIIKNRGNGSIGLAYRSSPPQGGSIYQLPQGPWADPGIWPLRYQPALTAKAKP